MMDEVIPISLPNCKHCKAYPYVSTCKDDEAEVAQCITKDCSAALKELTTSEWAVEHSLQTPEDEITRDSLEYMAVNFVSAYIRAGQTCSAKVMVDKALAVAKILNDKLNEGFE